MELVGICQFFIRNNVITVKNMWDLRLCLNLLFLGSSSWRTSFVVPVSCRLLLINRRTVWRSTLFVAFSICCIVQFQSLFVNKLLAWTWKLIKALRFWTALLFQVGVIQLYEWYYQLYQLLQMQAHLNILQIVQIN